MSGGQKAFGLLRRQPFVVDTIQPVRMHVPFAGVHIMHGMCQHHDTARREHHVIIECLGQPFPQLQRMFVDGAALLEQIIRSNDCGVAPRVAAAKPALFKDRYVADAMQLREIVGGGEPVPTPTDDDDIISWFWFGRSPLRGPTLMIGE